MSAAIDMPPDNPFRRLWDLGYRRLVPIVPPDAELSANSTLSKRPGARGKAVGIRGSGGWHGFNWHTHVATEDDIERWHDMGAGVGIRTGEGLVALDIDSLDPAWAGRIQALAWDRLGVAPRRYGRAPKVLMPYVVVAHEVGIVTYRAVHFDDGTVFEPGKGPRVELLAGGRQFVAEADHPATLKPYRWEEPLPSPLALPRVTADQIDDFFAELAAMLPGAQAPTSGKVIERRLVDQGALVGPVAEVERLVALIPNDDADWNSYVRMASAIRAACADDPHAGLNVYLDWCARWEIGADDPALNERTYWSVQPPFGVGLPWLEARAGRATGTVQTLPELWFERGPVVDVSHFPAVAPARGVGSPDTLAIDWIDPARWTGVERPEQRWAVEGVIPLGEVTLKTGRGGIGKTLLAQQILTHIALGLPVLGRRTWPMKVGALFCEDGEDVLHARQVDICTSLGVELADLSPMMRLASRKYMDNLLSIWDRNTSSMKRTALFDALLEFCLSFGIRVLVLDTIADTFGGDEINRQQVRQFIQSCAGRLAAAMDGAVILLGHPSRSGEQTGEGTSGSTAWHATVRSRLFLEEAGAAGSGYRKLTSMKSNYGPAGDSWLLQWRRGVLETVSSSRAAPGSDAGPSSLPSTANDLEALVLAAVSRANADGVRLMLGKTSKYRAETVLRQREPATFAPYASSDVDDMVQRLFALGHLVERELGKDAARRPVLTLCYKLPSVFD